MGFSTNKRGSSKVETKTKQALKIVFQNRSNICTYREVISRKIKVSLPPKTLEQVDTYYHFVEVPIMFDKKL